MHDEKRSFKCICRLGGRTAVHIECRLGEAADQTYAGWEEQLCGDMQLKRSCWAEICGLECAAFTK